MTNQDEKDLVSRALEDPENLREMEYEWFIDETIVKLERVMEEMGVSRSVLAERLACSPANVTRLLRHSSNLTLRKLMDLALALGHRALSPDFVPVSTLAPWESDAARPLQLISPHYEGAEFASASLAWPQAREAEANSSLYTTRQNGEFNAVS